MSDTQTPFGTRCDILGDIWTNYKNDEQFAEFVEYNDLGLPLAYAISVGIVSSTPLAEGYINETFDLLIEAVGLTDTGFDSLDDIMVSAGQA